ncbi:MAG TPA: delta-60 repeat domain-containing protein [Tahibacter sp.]|nr:delta-60 repeat domain-containing protein [Tahibacter sp.]
MRSAALSLLLLLGLPLAATAEQPEPGFRLTINGLSGFRGIAQLPLPAGRSVVVFEWANQPGVCNDPACIGLQFIDASGASEGFSQFKAAALQSVRAATVDSRGRIIVVGDYQGGASGVDFGIVRFNPDGSDDTSFAGDGGTTVDFGLGQANNDYVTAVAVDRYDNIVVVGSVQRASAGDTDFGIARLRAADGSLDTDFSGDGKTAVFFDLGPATRLDQPNAVAVRNDGRIMIAGLALDSAVSRTRVALARLNADGSNDASFCNSSCNFNGGYTAVNNGRRVYYFGNLNAHSDEVYGVDVAANNDIVIVGRSFATNGSAPQAAIARFADDGNQTAERLEPGTGGNAGFRDVRFADATGTRVIATGQSDAGPNYFAVQAFTATLTPEASYGGCLTSLSAICLAGSGGGSDLGPDASGQLHLDAYGRPLFAGTYLSSVDPTRSRVLAQRISNTTGPKPDRIFRYGFQ